MMKKPFFLICSIFISVPSALYADTYLGLTPGKSKKEDVEEVLSKPVREVLYGVRYEYISKDDKYKRIFVTFDPETSIIKAINLDLKEKLRKIELVKKYKLNKPTKTRLGVNDQLIEYYLRNGISLHYDGKHETSNIKSVCHFDPQIIHLEDSKSTIQDRPTDLVTSPGVITYTPQVMAQIGRVSPDTAESSTLQQQQGKTQQKSDSPGSVPTVGPAKKAQKTFVEEEAVLDLSNSTEHWAREWKVVETYIDFANGGKADFYARAAKIGDANPSPGRHGILYLHPKSQSIPARLARLVTLKGASPLLKMAVCGNRNVDGDWVLVVKADGSPMGQEKLIKGPDGWQDLSYDLSAYSGESVLIEIEARANNWWYEYAFFDYIRIEDYGEQETTDSGYQETKQLFEVMLAEDFDAENNRRGQLNYRGFKNWTVIDGEVDLIGHDFWDFYPEHGLYVDLDGNANRAGTLRSKTTFKLIPGTYKLEFDLAGHPLRTKNTVTVSIGNVYSEVFTLDAKEVFRTVTRHISVSRPTSAAVVFRHHGNDNAGLLLDNIRLSKSACDKSSIAKEPPGQGTRAYLGVQVIRHEGKGVRVFGTNKDSPAEKAGLRKDDIILEIENISFQQKVLDISRFTKIASELPTDRPVRFLIERNLKQFEVWVKPAAIDAQKLAKIQEASRQEFKPKDDFEIGKEMLRQRKFSQAVEHFQRTVSLRPRDSYEMLGISYFHWGRMKEAFENLEKAYIINKTSPFTVYYIAVYYDKIGKATHAIHYYKEFLKLQYDNAQMGAFANERLRELAGKRRKQTMDALKRIFDAVIEEMDTQ